MVDGEGAGYLVMGCGMEMAVRGDACGALSCMVEGKYLVVWVGRGEEVKRIDGVSRYTNRSSTFVQQIQAVNVEQVIKGMKSRIEKCSEN